MIIAKDSVVTVDYSITDSDGTLLEVSGDEPLKFIQGSGALVPGLEKELEGKSTDQELSVTLKPEEAFGTRTDELIREVYKSDFESPEDIKEGMVFHADLDGDGMVRFYTITSIGDEMVTIDGNHPFADKTLTFKLKVLDVREATKEELAHGHVHDAGDHHHH